MSYTKRQIVDGALSEIGQSPDVYDIDPADLQEAMRRLDAMFAEWNARGIRLGFPLPSSPEGGDLDADTGLPDSAWQAAVAGLALRIAPIYGKAVMRETKVAAHQGLKTLLSLNTQPPLQQGSRVPLGAGNKPWRYWREFTTTTDPLDAGPDGELTL